MDIKQALNTNLQQVLGKQPVGSELNLKLDQLLDAKVVETQTILNTFTVKVADKTLQIQSNQPLNLQPGQTLQLQVSKLLPLPEFKLLPAMATQTAANQPALPETPILKLLGLQQPGNPAPPPTTELKQLVMGQRIQVSVVNITDNKITVQLTNGQGATPALPMASTQTTANPQLITLDIKQLVMLANPGLSSPTAEKTAPPTTSVPLNVGNLIDLQVVKTGNNPTFAVLPQSTTSHEKILEALKQLLPIQAPPNQWLQQLDRSLPALQSDATVGETLKRLAQEIMRSMPATAQLSDPLQLKRAVAESGLYLEAKLAQLLQGKDHISLQDDFKFKLVKLVQLLTQAVKANPEDSLASDTLQLLKDNLQKTQGALARLTLDQLTSLPKEEASKQSWLVELPFFHNRQADSVKIAIELDKQREKDEQRQTWAVSITITPPDLATIHCKISCHDGSINTRFWSEQAATVDKINAHLDYLKQQLEQKGLTTGFMEAHQGQPKQTDPRQQSRPNLLNEKV